MIIFLFCFFFYYSFLLFDLLDSHLSYKKMHNVDCLFFFIFLLLPADFFWYKDAHLCDLMQAAGKYSLVTFSPQYIQCEACHWALDTSRAACTHTSPTSSISSPSLLATSHSSSDAHTETKAYTYKQGDHPLSSPDTSKHTCTNIHAVSRYSTSPQ